MGRERTGKRSHLFLYLAGLIVLLFVMSGCVGFIKQWHGKQQLDRAKSLLSGRDYQSSLRENEEVLRLFPQVLGDQALFQMGLIYAHPDNPARNYQKSVQCLQMIIEDFPSSSLRCQAEILVLFLRAIAKKDDKLQELTKKKRLLDDKLNKKKQEIENLRNQINKFKEIDLGIEEKKRNVLPE